MVVKLLTLWMLINICILLVYLSVLFIKFLQREGSPDDPSGERLQ
jgi:hypothetical protein